MCSRAGPQRLSLVSKIAPYAGAALLACATSAAAQAWPAKPVRMIVPYAPGGVADLSARVYGPKLVEALGQSVVIDNRPGANGAIGAEMVARSVADGYTLLMATASELTINPAVYSKLGYDTVRDFTPIGLVSHNPVVLVANAATPYKTLADLIAAAKVRPDTIAYASPGSGSIHHLSMELLRMMGGPALIQVPFKGGGPAAAAVVGGETPLAAVALAPALPHLRAGRIRTLGLASSQRSALAPDAPTLAEAGFGIVASNWVGLLAPAKPAPSIVQRLNEVIVRAARSADVRDRLSAAGSEAASSTPAEFAALISEELAKFAKVARTAKVKVN